MPHVHYGEMSELCYNLPMFRKLYSIVIKVRTWGLSGVFDYLKKLPHDFVLTKFLKSNAKAFPYLVPERGITLIGKFSGSGSASKTLRDFAFALKAARIPFQTFDTCDNKARMSAEDCHGIMTPRSEFRLKRYDHIVEIFPSILPPSLRAKHARIAFWEFESGFLHGYPDMPNEQCVIAMSDFNAVYFSRILPQCTVHKILYPFHLLEKNFDNSIAIRRKYNIPVNAFMVFFNFDFNAGMNRKNPLGAINAFAQAFKATPNTHLVIKTKGAKTHPEEYESMMTYIKSLGISQQFTAINAYIPEPDIYGLTSAADVYLSLHRGEGFGITLAEAMYMGKPVICTNWSSTTEFCKDDCTIPIPYKMTPVKAEEVDHPYYQDVVEWADPDVDAAAEALKQLHSDPKLRDLLGQRAAQSIREQFSIANFKESVERFLDS